jgi:colanic acid biosynthesis glycosyl transferase WcaI
MSAQGAACRAAVDRRDPLRVLVYGINFAPECTGVGKYTGEMCDWLAAAGHEVRVVTAPPWYPERSTPPPYSARRYSFERRGTVRVRRAPLWVPRRSGGPQRLAQMLSFAASSSPLMLANLGWRPDVVWTVSPSLACAPVAWAVARLAGAAAWLHVQDFEVDAAFGLGLLNGGPTRAAASASERALLRSFDRVSTISGSMLARLVAKGVPAERARLFPNWTELGNRFPTPAASRYRAELGIPPTAIVALYSGSMGAKQGLSVLANAARAVADDQRIHIVLCGAGPGLVSLREAARGLERVHWLPLQPNEQLHELLGVADLHLLPERRGAADLVMPSKLMGMLASGRPVVATVDCGSEVARLVARCGLVVPPEDSAALAAAIRQLADAPEERLRLGAEARSVAESSYGRDRVLGAFDTELRDTVARLVVRRRARG